MNEVRQIRCPNCGKLMLIERQDCLFLRNKGIIFKKDIPSKGQILCKNCGTLNSMPIYLR